MQLKIADASLLTTSPENLPGEYDSRMMTQAPVRYVTFTTGSCLTQEIHAGHYGYRQFLLRLTGKTCCWLWTPAGCLSLIYVPEGAIQLPLRGRGAVRLGQGRERLLYLPAGIHLEARMEAGEHFICALGIPPELPASEGAANPDFKDIAAHLKQGAPGWAWLPSVRLTRQSAGMLTELRQCPDTEPSRTRILQTETQRLLDHHLARLRGPVHLSGRITDEIKHLQSMIVEDLGIRYQTKELASLSATSTRNLNRISHKVLGKSMGRYMLEKRMEEAMMLVKKGDRSIQEISLQLGYREISSFTRAFRKHYGRPPSYFRGK